MRSMATTFTGGGRARHPYSPLLLILLFTGAFVLASSTFFFYQHREQLGASGAVHDFTPSQLVAATGVGVEERGRNLYMEVEQLKAEVRELENIVLQQPIPAVGAANVSEKRYPAVKHRSQMSRLRILVTGGAGFVGSHLVDRLMREGHEVIALDNFQTGRRRNVEHWIGHPNFELVHHDIVNPYYSEVHQIYHLASPASPPHYMRNPVKTLKTNILGTINMCGLARRVKARVLLASTSEVYGDPEVSPQPETYWGRVNTQGPRGCYDEGKRAAEALLVAFASQEGLEVRTARIFNTFGPRMFIGDGRVVSNFIIQALKKQPLTIYGTGKQTRSFAYVSDLVSGLVALMESNVTLPVNLGNPEEFAILEFAHVVQKLINGSDSSSNIVYLPPQQDDPHLRRPDINRAREMLGWAPKVSVMEGLRRTIDYFRDEINDEGNAIDGAEDAMKILEQLRSAGAEKNPSSVPNVANFKKFVDEQR